MLRLALFSLLLSLASLPAAGQRRHPYFSTSQPRPYHYNPKPYAGTAGPRIVEIGFRYGGAGRRGYGGRFHRYYDRGHHYGPGRYRDHYGYRGRYGYRSYYRYRSPYSFYPRDRSTYNGYGYRGSYGRAGVYRLYLTSPTGGTLTQANSADLVIDVDPPRALIFIDSKLVGSGRDFASDQAGYPLLTGEYELRVEHPGYEPFTTQLQIVPDRTVHLSLELKRREE